MLNEDMGRRSFVNERHHQPCEQVVIQKAMNRITIPHFLLEIPSLGNTSYRLEMLRTKPHPFVSRTPAPQPLMMQSVHLPLESLAWVSQYGTVL